MNLTCPVCSETINFDADESALSMTCPSCNSEIGFESLLASIETNSSTSKSADEKGRDAIPSIDAKVGDTVHHFRLLRELGQGGFGMVFAALDERLQREVALKIPVRKSLTPDQIHIFTSEAQSAAQLNHPNIVSIHTVADGQDGVYIVSELIDGETLEEWAVDRKLSQNDIASLIAKLARGLNYAHERSVIHRDIKPKNVMVDKKGEPFITDFGLAKRDHLGDASIAGEGRIMGTPAYMSPEQARGHSNQVDGRTDVFSLGVVLYELLTGERPFQGNPKELIRQIARCESRPVRKVDARISPVLEAICAKAMAKRPADRYATAGELADELERFVAGKPTRTRPLSPVHRTLEFFKQYQMVGYAAFGIVSIAALIYLILANRTPPADPNRYLVSFKVIPAAKIAVIPIDPETGLDKLDEIMRYPPQNNYYFNLTPGRYRIEAYKPGVGLVEVIRTVPDVGDDPFVIRGIETPPHRDWKRTEESIVLPSIHIIQPKIPESDLVTLQGGQFSDDEMFLFLASQHVDSFRIMSTEVLVRHLRQLNIDLPPKFDSKTADDPICRVSYDYALQVAEKLGMRLPTYAEYFFAASNGGKTKFPTGENPIDFTPAYSYGPIAERIEDKTTNGIYGLCSGPVEWTQTTPNPKDFPVKGIDLSNTKLIPYGFSPIAEGEPSERVLDLLRKSKPTVPQAHQSEFLKGEKGIGCRFVIGNQPRFVEQR